MQTIEIPTHTAFKAYDIRGRVPQELNEELAYRIGRAYAGLFDAEKIAVGSDNRISGSALKRALIEGLTDSGCSVFDIGICGTEMLYFATFHLGLDGGIMVTASHNPRDYNGMKLVRSGARPISGDSGLRELEKAAVGGALMRADGTSRKGLVTSVNILPDYVAHLLTYINRAALRPLKVVVNAGNGCAGPVLDALSQYLPFEFIRIHHMPDGSFPNGIPNPLLEDNRASTIQAVLQNRANIGIAWDGDFDRCFLFNEQGQFVEGYYIVGFLAQAMLRVHPGARIIHDPRLTWNTTELVREAGGIPVRSKTGHAFMKERMRAEDAVYGGEMSAHHYFKDFSYCDSGMIPWLLILEIMSRENKTLSELLKERISRYPASGEINRSVTDPPGVINFIEKKYSPDSMTIDKTDGLSLDFDAWRFNLRMSNTEPVIRLNVETKGDPELLKLKTTEILHDIDAYRDA
jgi:phosphomannomutase